MAYQYRNDNTASGSEYLCYVEYNITPDFSTKIFPGDVISAKGSFMNDYIDVPTRSVICSLYPCEEYRQYLDYSGAYFFGMLNMKEVAVSVAAGKVGTFPTVQFPLTVVDENGESLFLPNSPREIKAYLLFEFNSYRYGEENVYGGGYVDENATQCYTILRYHLNPNIVSFSCRRSTETGGTANDGRNLLCEDLKVTLDDQGVQSDITIKTLTIKEVESGRVIKTVEISDLQLKSMLGSGYKETKPELFSNVQLELGLEYDVTITIGDEYDQTSYTILISRARAVVDFNPNGFSVGTFSTATKEHPKFEVAPTHEAVFYGSSDFHGESVFQGGIAGVTNYVAGEVFTGGHWTDGKPIFRYIWAGTSSLDGKQGVACTLPVAPAVMIQLRATVKSGTGWRPIPNSYYGDNNWACNIYAEGAKIYLGFGSKWDGSKSVVIFAEYTKPDTAAALSLPVRPEILTGYAAPYADAGVARADYIGMMANIVVPIDEETDETIEVSNGVRSVLSEIESPVIEASAHSRQFDTVKAYYTAKVWSAQMVKDAIDKWITAEEAEEILAIQRKVV